MRNLFLLSAGLLLLSTSFAAEIKLFGEQGVRGEIWGYHTSNDRYQGTSTYYNCKKNSPAKVFLSFHFIDMDSEDDYWSWNTKLEGLNCDANKKLVYNGVPCTLKESVKTIKKNKYYQLNSSLSCPGI